MKRNGFTLIELLAVIVILAIIALIATPIILGIINDARKESNERSVELYASAVRNAIASYQLTHPNAPTKFSDLNVQYDGEIECAKEELYADGSFYIAECTVNGTAVDYTYGEKQGLDKACTLEDKDGDGVASLSDVVICGTESFYVMENANNEITMLSKYNLHIGFIWDLDNSIDTPLENPTGIQSELTLTEWIAIPFDDYSQNNMVNGWVYDETADLYPYINSYENYLKENGVSSAMATLPSLEQLEDLGCSVASRSCIDAPEWVWPTSYGTGYYTGNLGEDIGVWTVYDKQLKSTYDTYIDNGVRPVVIISTSEL